MNLTAEAKAKIEDDFRALRKYANEHGFELYLECAQNEMTCQFSEPYGLVAEAECPVHDVVLGVIVPFNINDHVQ